jgi:small-conductance mechanosensitive channel
LKSGEGIEGAAGRSGRSVQKSSETIFAAQRIQYHLMAHLGEGENRAEVISELHAQIQDPFNEFGVQIMSPPFESQPEKKVFVPKPEWHTAPASPPPVSDEGNRKPASGPDSPL